MLLENWGISYHRLRKLQFPVPISFHTQLQRQINPNLDKTNLQSAGLEQLQNILTAEIAGNGI